MFKVKRIIISAKRELLYLVLTVISVVFIFNFIDFRLAGNVLLHVNWLLIVISILLGFFGVFIRYYRLQYLINLVTRFPLDHLIGLSYITSLFGLVLPYSGGVAISYYISKQTKTSFKKIFSIFFFEYFFSFILTVIMGGIGLLYFIRKNMLIYSVNYLWLIIILLSLLTAGVCGFRLIRNILIKKYAEELGQLAQFAVKARQAVIPFTVLTFLLLITSFLQIYIIYTAFNMYPSFPDLIMAVNVMGVIGYIPGVLLKIGQEEAVGILLLPYLLGLDKNTIFTLIVTNRVIYIILSAVLGLLFLYIYKIDLHLLQSFSVVKRKLS